MKPLWHMKKPSHTWQLLGVSTDICMKNIYQLSINVSMITAEKFEILLRNWLLNSEVLENDSWAGQRMWQCYSVSLKPCFHFSLISKYKQCLLLDYSSAVTFIFGSVKEKQLTWPLFQSTFTFKTTSDKRSQREIVTNLLLRYSLLNPFWHFLYDSYLFILQSLMCNYLW